MVVLKMCGKRYIFTPAILFSSICLCFLLTYLIITSVNVPVVTIKVRLNTSSSLSGITWHLNSPKGTGQEEEDILLLDVFSNFVIQYVESEEFLYPRLKGCPSYIKGKIFISSGKRNRTLEVELETPAMYMSSPESKSMEQQNNLRMSILNEILAWGLHVPEAFILQIDPHYPQLQENVTHIQAHHLLSCTRRDTHDYIPFFAKNVNFPGTRVGYRSKDFEPDQVRDLLLYLANCQGEIEEAVPDFESQLIQLKSTHCFLPNEKFKGNFTNAERVLLVPFSKEYLCNLPKSVIMQLRLFADTASNEKSLGLQIKLRMDRLAQYVDKMNSSTGLYLEIDSRITNLLGEYDYHCWNDPDLQKLTPASHNLYETMPFKKMTYIREGRYIKAVLENDMVANMKYIGNTNERPRSPTYFNQGTADLVSHYIDIVLGMYITSTCVYRRVPLKPVCNEGECDESYDFKQYKLDGILGYDDNVLYSRNMMNQYKKDSSGNYYVDFTMIGWIKDVFQGGHTVRLEPLTSELSLLKKYFQHTIKQSQMLSHKSSRQDLLDISDILLFNFLVHDWDHAWIHNWMKSGLRLFCFDSGLGFDPRLPGPSCPVLLQCPYIFCQIIRSKITCKSPNDTLPFCRFNKNTYIRLLRVSEHVEENKQLGARIRNIVKNSPWYTPEFDEYFGPYEIGSALDNRIDFAIKHIDFCKNLYGEDVFI